MAMQPKNASDIITFARSTAAWEWDWQGNYSEVAAGVMRIAHDPLTKSTSTTPQTLGTGSYTFAVTYQYPVGKAVRVSADANNWMVGRVTAASPTSVTLWVSAPPVGAGTYSAWTLIVRRGILVEEQRTNLLLQSGDFANGAWLKASGVSISTDGQLAPNGAQMPLVTLAGTTNHHINQLLASPLTAGQSYTLTCYVLPKSAPFNFQLGYYDGSTGVTAIDVLPVAGQIQRLSFTFTPAVTAVSPQIRLLGFGNGGAGAQVYLWGAQLEQAASPSSYIPTTASQVIRAADVPTVNTLSPWYNATEGTIVVKAISSPSQPAPISEAYAALRGASINDRIEIAKATAQTNITGAVVAGGVAQANMNGVTLPPNTGFSAALSYKANDFAFSLNGGAVATDKSGSVPVVALLQIGSRSSANQCNGIIEDITYHPRVIDVQQASA